MADLSQTITNSLNVFGPAPSNKWAAYNWNAFKWGEGTTDLAVSVLKVLSESITPSDVFTKSQVHTIANTLSPTSDMTSESVLNGGYYRLFPGSATNGENRVDSSWSGGSSSSPSWSQGTASSTSWSAA